jgi:hypothetical protein
MYQVIQTHALAGFAPQETSLVFNFWELGKLRSPFVGIKGKCIPLEAWRGLHEIFRVFR